LSVPMDTATPSRRGHKIFAHEPVNPGDGARSGRQPNLTNS
jgi:hypothetical protein